jgi:hypothetical protein
VGYERKISAGERPQTQALASAATGIGKDTLVNQNLLKYIQSNVN